MKKVILDVDDGLFGETPTPYDVVSKIEYDEETKEVLLHFVYIDENLNRQTFEKKKKDSLKTLLEVRDYIRSLYSYLITTYNEEVTVELATNIKKLCDIKERQLLKTIRVVASALLFVPAAMYAGYNLKEHPILYSVLGIISIGQLLKSIETFPLINELKEEYEEVVKTNDSIFFTEGPKLIRRERKSK